MDDQAAPAVLDHFFAISRLLAGQLDFRSAIRAVAAEVAAILPHDHLDVCIVRLGGRFHTAYETGIDTDWGSRPLAPVAGSPIRSLLMGEVDHILTDDACTDPRFSFEGAFHRPIQEHSLRSRIHVPMMVHGAVIGALSCSLRQRGRYGAGDVVNARSVADLLSPYFFALRAADEARESAVVETEARAREEGLRLGALRLTEALEAERQRIGMDLHDQTLADLTRLTRRLERLADAGAAGGPALAGAIEPVARGLHRCMQDLRQIIETARPSVLDLFGFAQAIENHLERSVRDSGQSLCWQLDDDTGGAIDRLEPTVRTALFRIVQEAVNNAVQHAGAARITVALGALRGQIALAVTDDGRGNPRRRGRIGSGIDNMKTRARLISARFALGPGPGGRGTTVSVSLPLPPAGAVPVPAAEGTVPR
ncbi:MAG: sensor histidine kinase [Alphaproteobacteria bacterium HGW-Alphaproteobacteria-6]|nr:MAG: sensor histidine kinase [Alphaproteobacteria bacterium HGW-Alphaproteobacteria-6]